MIQSRLSNLSSGRGEISEYDFHSALAPTVDLGVSWPPAGIDPLNPNL